MQSHGQALKLSDLTAALATKLMLLRTDDDYRWWEATTNAIALVGAGVAFAVAAWKPSDVRAAVLVGGGSLTVKSAADLVLPLTTENRGVQNLMRAISENVVYSRALRTINVSMRNWYEVVSNPDPTEKEPDNRKLKPYGDATIGEVLRDSQLVLQHLEAVADAISDAKSQLEDAKRKHLVALLPEADADIKRLHDRAIWLRSNNPNDLGIIYTVGHMREELLIARTAYERALEASK